MALLKLTTLFKLKLWCLNMFDFHHLSIVLSITIASMPRLAFTAGLYSHM